MKHAAPATLLLLAAGLLNAPSLAREEHSRTRHEIFTLRPGIHYVYQYWYRENYSDPGRNITTTDSGVVQYAVLDSAILNDTTTQWSVVQLRSLFRYIRVAYGRDTSFWIRDTVGVTMSESLQGDHPLSCTSQIWSFPIVYPRSSLRPGVFRFSDSSQVAELITFIPPTSCAEGYDTLRFSHDSSFFARSMYWRHYCNISGGSGRLVVRLLERTVIAAVPGETPPLSLKLHPNYPNPFNPRTTIVYDLPAPFRVTLSVFDLLGRTVAVLVDEVRPAGRHEVPFDAAGLSSGLYFCRLAAPGGSTTQKMILQR